MTSETFSLPWVQGGEPFTLDPEDLSMADVLAIQRVRHQVLKEELADIPGDLPENLRNELVGSAREVAQFEQSAEMLYRLLCGIDGDLQAHGKDYVMERLGQATVRELLEGMDVDVEELERAARGEGSGADPLGSEDSSRGP